MPPTSPQEYLQRINAIIGDEVPDGKITLNVSWTNRSDAKAAVARLRDMQVKLRFGSDISFTNAHLDRLAGSAPRAPGLFALLAATGW